MVAPERSRAVEEAARICCSALSSLLVTNVQQVPDDECFFPLFKQGVKLTSRNGQK